MVLRFIPVEAAAPPGVEAGPTGNGIMGKVSLRGLLLDLPAPPPAPTAREPAHQAARDLVAEAEQWAARNNELAIANALATDEIGFRPPWDY